MTATGHRKGLHTSALVWHNQTIWSNAQKWLVDLAVHSVWMFFLPFETAAHAVGPAIFEAPNLNVNLPCATDSLRRKSCRSTLHFLTDYGSDRTFHAQTLGNPINLTYGKRQTSFAVTGAYQRWIFISVNMVWTRVFHLVCKYQLPPG